jgi:hypothetical protein
MSYASVKKPCDESVALLKVEISVFRKDWLLTSSSYEHDPISKTSLVYLPIGKLPLSIPILWMLSAYLFFCIEGSEAYQIFELFDMIGPRMTELPVRRKKD